MSAMFSLVGWLECSRYAYMLRVHWICSISSFTFVVQGKVFLQKVLSNICLTKRIIGRALFTWITWLMLLYILACKHYIFAILCIFFSTLNNFEFLYSQQRNENRSAGNQNDSAMEKSVGFSFISRKNNTNKLYGKQLKKLWKVQILIEFIHPTKWFII